MSDDPNVDTDPTAINPAENPTADDDDAHSDCFAPPDEPCECYCLHCRRTFMSSAMWFQRIRNPRGEELDGFWMCPTANCDGKGFAFDIFPTDPDHPANDGWFSCDEGEGDDPWLEDDEDDDPAAEAEAEYDPDEPQYQQLDGLLGDDADDDIEGEEWKYGLQPGEQLDQPLESSDGAFEVMEEEARYDAPDERPREIVWEEPSPGAGGGFDENDIPF